MIKPPKKSPIHFPASNFCFSLSLFCTFLALAVTLNALAKPFPVLVPSCSLVNTDASLRTSTEDICCTLESVLVAQSCPTLCDPWTVAHQVPLSMGFSRQEYWNGLACPFPGDLSAPWIERRSPAWQILYCLSRKGSPGCALEKAPKTSQGQDGKKGEVILT